VKTIVKKQFSIIQNNQPLKNLLICDDNIKALDDLKKK